MYYIQIQIEDFSSRVAIIRDILKPLRDAEVACEIRKGKFEGGKVIAAHSGNTAGKDYRDLMFPSRARSIRCQYFELWKPKEGSRQLFLEKAYLTIKRRNTTTHGFDELIALHCDPNNTDNGLLKKFKQGPHLHVSVLDDPLPKCHFPLNYSQLDLVLTSPETLTDALRNAIMIITEEVIVRCA